MLAATATPIAADGPEVLRVGHWIELKGSFDEDGSLVVSAAELLPVQKYEVLIGTVGEGETSWERFVLNGIPVTVSERIAAEGLPAASPAGQRLKVEGRYRGPRKFSAREIKSRGPGRDRLEGRIDWIGTTKDGFELSVMNASARIAGDLEVDHEQPLSELTLIPPRVAPVESTRVIDEDDEIPETIVLAQNLFLGGQIEGRSTIEDELDLDETDDEDRVNYEAALRARLRWLPRDDLELVATWRRRQLWRIDDDDGRESSGNGRMGETYLRWSNALGRPVDVVIGRQDFDEDREWLYDEDLDAVRVFWRPGPVLVELSASTVLADGSDRNEDSTNFVAYVSNDDEDLLLAAYVIDRRDSSDTNEEPIHFGLRAIGELLPANDSWAELSLVKGFIGDIDREGIGWDIGTTYSPDFLGPLDVTVGWAFADGDDPGTAGEDEAFVQTGLQDNNDKFGGVTSFRYYGELVDPELSNLSILTVGIGARIAHRTSLDLVWHAYRQDVAANSLRDSDLDGRPDGVHRELGTELDLILGCRAWKSWDFEISAAWFRPGDAFPGGDDAFIAKFQARYKF